MAASTLIEPWLSVSGGAKAVEFYKTAFDATEVFHLEDPDGNVVSRLSINGATFWLSDGPANEHKENIPVRMIVTVEDPDTVFAHVIKAGADDFVEKPFELSYLLKVIERNINGAKNGRPLKEIQNKQDN